MSRPSKEQMSNRPTRNIREEAEKLNDNGVYILMRHLILVAKRDLLSAQQELDYWGPQYFRAFGKNPTDAYKEQVMDSNPFAKAIDIQYRKATFDYENTVAFFDTCLFKAYSNMPGHEYAKRLLSGEFRLTEPDDDEEDE